MRSIGEALAGVTALLEPCVLAEGDRSLGSTADEDLIAGDIAEHLLGVLRLKGLAVHDAEGMGAREGFRSTSAWFATRTRRAAGAVHAEVMLARRLFNGDLAETAALLPRMGLTLDQARAIHAATRGLAPEDVAKLQGILLAADVGPDQIRALGRYALTRIEDESTAQAKRERALARRSADLVQVGDQCVLQSNLTPEAEALLTAMFTAHAGPVPGPGGEPDLRTASMRRHDALLGMIRTAARTARGEDLGERSDTLLHVVVDVEDLQRLQDPKTPEDHDRRRQCCDADLTWTLTHTHDRAGVDPAQPRCGPHRPRAPEGRALSPEEQQVLRQGLTRIAPALGGIGLDVLNQGRRQRYATPAQNRALAIRDRGCIVPGCTAPVGWCESHHYKTDWALGGLTDLDDLAKVCGWHHHLIHDQHWTMLHNRDGTWTFTRPDPGQQQRRAA